MSPSSLLGAADAGDQSAILALNHLQGRIPSAWTITAPTVARCAVEFWQWADAHIVRSPIELPVPADSLPLDEPLDRRVTIGLAKIGIALKQAWAEAGHSAAARTTCQDSHRADRGTRSSMRVLPIDQPVQSC
jgi:hypothetical protein